MREHLTFGAWLRGRRAEKGQTQDDAVAAVGCSRASWADWEAEKRLPVKIADLVKLAEWSGDTTPIELFAIVVAATDETPEPTEVEPDRVAAS